MTADPPPISRADRGRTSSADPDPTPDTVDVLAAVITRGDRWLLARRPKGKRHGGRWELPGGKLRQGETLATGASRELAEELAVRVLRVGKPRASLRDPGSPYLVHFCPVEIAGEPRALEHPELRWVTPEEARGMPLAPTDRAFVDSYRLSATPSKKEPPETPMSRPSSPPESPAAATPETSLRSPRSSSRGDGDRDPRRDFIRAMIADDLDSGRRDRVVTRFPPEPNGYLHIGHAKSIVLNFGVAEEFGGVCHLRFDDTNPETEDPEYVESIQRDIRWLGYDWGEKLFFGSDYFERMAELGEKLIREGKAYVDSLSDEEIRKHRGTVTEPGRPSPYRDRSVEENLDLFRRMRAGEFPDGAHVLRARIDLAAANMKMRDPLIYRIRHASHYRQGDDWCIYPMYDWAHPLEDAFEGITHSLCTLEFENNREIYDWVVENCGFHGPDRPYQTEFARLNLSYTVMSKRKLLQLVRENRVDGWDDPRMPTLSGMRRRGYTPSSIRTFCERVGVAKANSVVDVAQLEHTVRDELNHEAPRLLAVLRPLKVVLTNFPKGRVEELDAPHWPHDIPKEGSRKLPFTRELWIDRQDFREDPPTKFHRLAPGREVRLRYGYFIRCDEVIEDDAGEITELRCSYDPETRGGSAPDGRKVKGTIHWVSAERNVPAEVRLYDRLFRLPRPDAEGRDFRESLNPDSLEVLREARIEESVATAEPGSRFQFEREGYFYLEPHATQEAGRPVYNRIVPLKDTWAKVERRQEPMGKATSQPAQKKSEKATPPPPEPRREPGAELSGEDRERFEHLVATHALPAQTAEVLAADAELTVFFERAVDAWPTESESPDREGIANWLVHELLRELKERELGGLPFGPGELAELVALLAADKISGPAAKEVFEVLLEKGGRPGEIVERRGLEKVGDASALEPVVEGVLAAHGDEVTAYRGGKKQLLGFFIGQVMQKTGGTADPRTVRELLQKRLG